MNLKNIKQLKRKKSEELARKNFRCEKLNCIHEIPKHKILNKEYACENLDKMYINVICPICNDLKSKKMILIYF